jgi:DNA-binding beta-propeller fold protein YncE
MSLRTPRRHLAALIPLALALLLQACALTGEGVVRPAPAESAVLAQAGPGEIWQVLDGAPSGSGNLQLLTGAISTQLLQPIAVAARGHLVYIVDAGHQQLFRYDSRLDRLSVVMELKGVLHGAAADLHLNRDLSFYLADTEGARVLHFDADGRLLRTIEDRIKIGRPVNVSVNDDTGYLFIADGFNDDVLVYNPAGLLSGAIGVRGSGPGRFLGITALAQGAAGYYIATRYGPARVQLMGHDGAYREAFQQDTVTFPTAIAVDHGQRAFVADYLSDDIKVYQGSRLIGVIGGHGSAPGRFRRITDLWLDDGFLYVADSLNRRIQILTLASWQASPESSGAEPASQ